MPWNQRTCDVREVGTVFRLHGVEMFDSSRVAAGQLPPAGVPATVLICQRDIVDAMDPEEASREIADVPAVEVVSTVAVHLMTAAAVKCGLGEDPDEMDLDEARTLIESLAGLVVGATPYLGSIHAKPLRDGLRSLQLAFREASIVPDQPGKGPGEKFTGPLPASQAG